MYEISFGFSELHKHGSAFFDFLALRKKVFVDDLGWDVPHDDTLEMDQYDNRGQAGRLRFGSDLRPV